MSLQIPLFVHPDFMQIDEMISELKNRNLNSNGNRSDLSDRLLKVIIDENCRKIFDPEDMDDRQPEKWIYISILARQQSLEIEPDLQIHYECMKEVNKWIVSNIQTMAELKEVAKGNIQPENKSLLFLLLLKFGTGMMIEPEVEQQAWKDFKVSTAILRSSVSIFQMCTGFQERCV